MSANRLPSIKLEIHGCGDCPLRVSVDGTDGDELSECQHPEVPARAVAHDATEPPDFCPLIRAPLTITIGKTE